MKRDTGLPGARLALFVLVLLLFAVASPAAYAQDRTLYWQRYDVDLTVQQNGDLRIVETQELVFTSGTFRFGQREVLQSQFSDLRDVTVSELGGPEYQYSEVDAPYTYRVFYDSGYIKIRYNFPPSADMRRTIVIGYTVTDALRFYPDTGVDQLFWKVIPAGNPFPTQSSTITLHLPEPATFTNYGVYGADAEADFQTGQRDATIRIADRIRAGQEVEVVAEWQHGIVAGQPAPWQAELDQAAEVRRQEEQFRTQWGPVFDLGFLALGGLLAIGGPVVLYIWWYRRGRDKPVGLVADYLPEPPSELPPGMVGTLLDERADMEDIMSTLLDLARRGVLEIEEEKEPGFLGIGSTTDFIYRLKPNNVALRPYENLFVKSFFGKKDEVRLSDLKNKFHASLAGLRSALYQEVVREGLFKESPDAVRSRYGCLGMGALGATFFAGMFLLGIAGSLSSFAICIPLGLGVTAIGLIILARYMPVRTERGADEHARWSAFKRYLQNLEKYTKVEEATDIFSQYLPYAVAFGLEQSFIRKFEAVQAPPPTWWIPYGYPRPYYEGGEWSGAAAPAQPVAARSSAAAVCPAGSPAAAVAADSPRWATCPAAWARAWQA
jgi:hypothetical protein